MLAGLMGLIAARAAAAPQEELTVPVGTTRIEVTVDADRRVPVQLWYPADDGARGEAAAGHPLASLEPPGPRRDALNAVLARAHEPGTTRRFHAALDAAPRAGGSLPLVVYSHCMDGVRFASLGIAERLAGAGFVVAAPDHEGGTLYDKLAGRSLGITDAFLERRVADLRGLLDQLLARDGALPARLRGRLDPTRVGALGHSYGAATAGRLAQDDRRVRAGATLAAPAAGGDPLVSLVLSRMAALALLDRPWLYMLASEDLPFYNGAIARNFAAHPAAAAQVVLRDAGHYSFTDICGIVPEAASGCGEGVRTTPPFQPFRYLDVASARALAAEHVTAFFRAALLGVGGGPAALPAHEAATVTVRPKPAPIVPLRLARGQP